MEYPKAITGTPEPVSKASTNTETVKKDMFWSLRCPFTASLLMICDN